MIQRYSRAEMSRIWSPENRFAKMLEVECQVAEAQASLRLIPKEAAELIRAKGKFSVARIDEIEKTTRHDVIAFVTNVAENVGPMGRYVHFGLTSSDVLDTALSLIIGEAGAEVITQTRRLIEALKTGAKMHAETLCAGRTHGMHAEPTSFGMKLAGHWAEMERNLKRMERALAEVAICKLSGAVGTYSTQTSEIEVLVAKALKFVPETIATQVIPRDRHAEVFYALAMIGAGLERLSVELRHLQRTEVAEVTEGFSRGQKGSSAMPHKKNPISAENLTGCARLLRGYLLAGLEDIALWHERDISHSSVERVALPDAFILCDYALDRAVKLVEGLEVDAERMQHNMDLSAGQLFSSHLLLALVGKGLSREESYLIVQRLSHGLKPGGHLREAAKVDQETRGRLSEIEIDEVFSGARHKKAIAGALKRAGILSESV